MALGIKIHCHFLFLLISLTMGIIVSPYLKLYSGSKKFSGVEIIIK
jgi:hypothetical protein